MDQNVNVVNSSGRFVPEEGIYPGSRKDVADRLRRWGHLALWIALLWFSMFVALPWLERSVPAIRTLGEYIDSSGIDAGAIYYTDVEEVGEADLYIRDTFRFYLGKGEHGGETGDGVK